MDEITENDILFCWGKHNAIAYLTEILNGQYNFDEAKKDLQSLIGTKYDQRIGEGHHNG